MKSYKDLDIYNLAFHYSIEVHHASLKMPKFELYEQGGQVRRSSKSVKNSIIEIYGRRKYKQDFIKFLTYHMFLYWNVKDSSKQLKNYMIS
ncbi:four helix bundle protein [Aequorivita sp. SDUM287046]|uniref:Four helix bundle protein n=1 Tax=Aequorivita aurantiaca TaxID=3053356 RepID=A0ABT8DMR2_9FLAO|nr:four helix bundle protein [Aequorivita aurantiaca]MDN3725299.1 four helix bundle protein [Aequorivita aurantiaca]